MAEIQPERISWNYNNLDPNYERFPSYRLDISYIKYVTHDLTYGPEGIPQSFYLLINLNGALYREVPVVDNFITVDAVAGTPLNTIFDSVSNDITKPGFIFNGIYLDSEFNIPVTESDRLTENKTVFIKWIED
jgi:hypothetical protein